MIWRAARSCGLLGESGSGKTVTLRSILCLLPERRTMIKGRILFAGEDPLGLVCALCTLTLLPRTKIPGSAPSPARREAVTQPAGWVDKGFAAAGVSEGLIELNRIGTARHRSPRVEPDFDNASQLTPQEPMPDASGCAVLSRISSKWR